MKTTRQLRSQGGFTLVELMIGMVLSLFIVIALITLMININRNNSELSKSNRLIENGRLAMQLLTSDISHAGFLGGYVPNYDDLTNSAIPTELPTALPDPCLAFSAADWTAAHKTNLIAIHAAAYQVPSGGTAPACSSVVTNPKGLTDVLVIRHIEPCVAGAYTTGECSDTSAATSPDVYLQASRCTTDSVTYGTGTYVLSTTLFVMRKKDCATVNELRRFASTLYYVRTFSTTSGDGIPTLMRSQFGVSGTDAPTHLASQALVEGVEGFVVEFGLDNKSDDAVTDVDLTTAVTWAGTALTSPTNRGDGNPDLYVHCTVATPCTAATPNTTALVNAVTVKIYLLMRNDSKTAGFTDSKTYTLGSVSMGPFNDNYKRHVFTQTIRLNNVSGRRETPT